MPHLHIHPPLQTRLTPLPNLSGVYPEIQCRCVDQLGSEELTVNTCFTPQVIFLQRESVTSYPLLPNRDGRKSYLNATTSGKKRGPTPGVTRCTNCYYCWTKKVRIACSVWGNGLANPARSFTAATKVSTFSYDCPRQPPPPPKKKLLCLFPVETFQWKCGQPF